MCVCHSEISIEIITFAVTTNISVTNRIEYQNDENEKVSDLVREADCIFVLLSVCRDIAYKYIYIYIHLQTVEWW